MRFLKTNKTNNQITITKIVPIRKSAILILCVWTGIKSLSTPPTGFIRFKANMVSMMSRCP